MSFPYPVSPSSPNEEVIKPSAAFKQEVTKVLLAIVFFIVIYVALMSASIALAVLCGYGGIMLIALLPKLFTIMIGLGLVGLGAMVIYFLLKFLFKKNSTDRSHLIQIKEKDQPELFAFIRKLTAETKSPFPKKIYLSPDVNACVFYDSSFWSMFMPVRKNLQIGLGLVNSVNISEFKAIMAHEFGHFSQSSMKLGSYVYNVNQVIYNMLYDNEGYGRTLEGWANISGYFAFFAGITVKIVQGIQWILQQVYGVINKNYFSLSRQMEFHADSVAAYVSGGNHLVTSLRRLEVADSCYNKLFHYYNKWHSQNLRPDNLYPQHAEVLKHFSETFNIAIENGLPKITAGTFANMSRTRVQVKDQWASHPSTDDREKHLNQLNLITPADPTSAWVLFRNAEELQKEVTNSVYKQANFTKEPEFFNASSFTERYYADVRKNELNKKYKGFFDLRKIMETDLNGVEDYTPAEQFDQLDEILTEKTIGLVYTIEGLTTDSRVLQMIKEKAIPVKTFEFAGEKYSGDDSYRLHQQITTELKETEAQLADADRLLISFFARKAAKAGQLEELKRRYQQLFDTTRESEKDLELYNEIANILGPLYQGSVSFEQADAIINQVKLREVKIKNRLREFLGSAGYDEHEKEKVEEYLSKEYKYFVQNGFLDNELILLNTALDIFRTVSDRQAMQLKKDLLEWQLQL